MDDKPIRTKRKRFKEPRGLAKFIMMYAPGYIWLTGKKIKKKLPDLLLSAKRINEMQGTDEYYKCFRDEMPEINKRKYLAMSDMIEYKYFEKQMELSRGPDYKAVQHFGIQGGKIDPTGKLTLYDGDKMNEEQQKARQDEIVNALLNKIKREQKEKEEKEKDG